MAVSALRRRGRAARIAAGLWFAWAVIVWNVVFDHVIVVAGRRYIAAALRAAAGPGPYARMDDWMRPALTRAFWTASAAAGLILVILLAVLTSTRAAARAPGRASHR